MEEQLITEFYIALFLIAMAVGAVANRTDFCTMGAVSDWVNMDNKSRLYAWMLAIAVAILGTLALQTGGVISLDETRPLYRTSNFIWGQYLVGGLLFGIGMTLGSGCGNKTAVRLGAGNLKSLVVLLMMGCTAYLITATDIGYQLTFGLLAPLSTQLGDGATGQELSQLIVGAAEGESVEAVRLLISLLLVGGIFWIIFRNRQFRTNLELIAGGILIGVAVVAVWWVTGGSLGGSVLEAVEFMDNPPRGMGVQSLTFGAPTADLWNLLITGFSSTMITVGLVLLSGVVMGSLVFSLFNRSFRVEWFASLSDFINHLIGGVLMGMGAILGTGCTFGQGITGVSTLALGSFIVLFSIVFGSALTMKIQYYKLVYEEEATFVAALLSSLVDLRLLPAGLRKLDAV